VTGAKRTSAANLFFALCAGILFGLGLAVSQMVNPAKVIGFLDVAGNWDPTLAAVMAGALAVAMPAFRWVLKRPHPLFGASFSLPRRTDLDARLVIGAALFGIGWGVAGFCPGPAIAALTTLAWPVVMFVVAMLAGAIASDWFTNRR